MTPGLQAREGMAVAGSVRLVLEVPESTVAAVWGNAQAAEMDLRAWLAVRLFLEGRVSASSAAELVGVTRADFLNLVGDRRPSRPLTSEDVSEDVEALERVLGGSGQGRHRADGALAVAIDRDAVRRFCVRHGIRELSVFGSVLRDDFGPDSDVDVLVEFGPGAGVSLFGFVDLRDELSALVGRPVDLVSKSGLSPHLRERILASREVLYAREG